MNLFLVELGKLESTNKTIVNCKSFVVDMRCLFFITTMQPFSMKIKINVA